MRRSLLALVGGLALVACAAALALRFTPLLDSSVDGITSTVAQGELAKRYHHGARPCLRYSSGLVRSTDVEATAQALVDAGVPAERIAELAYFYFDQKETDEAAAHPRGEAEERLEVIVEAASPMQKPLVLLKRERLRKRLDALLTSPAAGHSHGAPLSVAEHAALDPVWRDHPEVLMVGGLVKVLPRMRALFTVKQLDALATFIHDGARRDSFQLSKLPPALMTDGYGQPIHTELRGKQVVLTSYGADHREGGTGEDADEQRAIDFTTGEVETLVAQEDEGLAVGRGDPPPASVSLTQAEVDSTLEHLEVLSGQARVVPAFVGGKVIGFKLFAIHKSSIYERLALENGDVVTAVDGMALISPEKALELYSHLRAAKSVNVALLRAGKSYTIRVDVKP